MNSSDFIFTSYCFDNEAAGGDYHAQQRRLKESILKIYPNANTYFVYENEATGKPKFQQSLYGFKVKLVNECIRQGFRKIIFFDTAMCLEKEVDWWFEAVKDYGVLSAIDRQKLSACTSDACMRYMGLTRDQLSGWNLTGGSIYVFDFDIQKCQDIFNTWQKMESAGLFGTQENLGNLQNHRMDETCMAIALYLNGSEPVGHDMMRYAYEKPGGDKLYTMGDDEYTPIAIKRHFK